jgi:hypothetical protein
MIIPSGWTSPTNDIREGQKSVLRDIFAKEDTSYISVDPKLGKKHFSGIGQTFTWFILGKGRYSGNTIMDLGDQRINLNLSKIKMLPKIIGADGISILQKLTSSNDTWNFTRYIMPESWDDISFDSNSSRPFARINGNSNHLNKVCYSANPCKLQTQKKVVLPYNGSHYLFVVDNGIQGCTNAYYMLLDDSQSLKGANIYFNSKLIKWVGTNKFTQYNEGALINSIGIIELTDNLTELDIYKHYNLTQKEIDYIENAVK